MDDSNEPFIPIPTPTSLPNTPFQTISLFTHLISLTILLLTLYRTYVYIKRRRNGHASPTMTPIFIKLWTVYALFESASHILSLYLTPFKATWLTSFFRAAFLPYLTWGSRFRNAVKIYDSVVVPFFDTHAPEIDTLLQQASKLTEEIDEAFRQIAQILLNRIAVGGLRAVAGNGKAAEDVLQDDPEGVQTISALPNDRRTFSAGRLLFAGQPSQKADTIANASLEAMRGVILRAEPQHPKAAFEDSRAMRRQFRSRKPGKVLD